MWLGQSHFPGRWAVVICRAANLPSNFIKFIFSSGKRMRDSRKRRHCDDLHQFRFESVLVQLPRNRIRQEVAVSLLDLHNLQYFHLQYGVINWPMN